MSKKHRLTPKYNILHLLVTLLRKYFVTMEEDDNQLKITCQLCNGVVTCSIRSGELLDITFLHSGTSTLGIYPEDIFAEIFYFQLPARTKMQRIYHNLFK